MDDAVRELRWVWVGGSEYIIADGGACSRLGRRVGCILGLRSATWIDAGVSGMVMTAGPRTIASKVVKYWTDGIRLDDDVMEI